MSNLGVNMVDVAVVGVLLVSGIFAFARGFVREVLGIVSWVVAIVGALQAFPFASALARRYMDGSLIPDIVAGGGVFLLLLVIASIATHYVTQSVRESAVNALDRSLGFLFGLVRGAVLVCLIWMGVDFVIQPKSQPAWILDARTRPLAVTGGEWLAKLVPGEMAGRMNREVERPASESRRSTGDTKKPEARTDSEKETGYKSDQRQDLEALIRNQQAKP